jgi:hypothetical protein
MSDDIENQRITIVPTQSRRRAHTGDTALTMRRTLSIRAPTVPPSARLPIEFRTLSVHLEHSKKSDHGGKAPKGAVKGQPLAPPIPPLLHLRAEQVLSLAFCCRFGPNRLV